MTPYLNCLVEGHNIMLQNLQKISLIITKYSCLSIGVGRFRILGGGGARFRIFFFGGGGGGGGANSQQAHDVDAT